MRAVVPPVLSTFGLYPSPVGRNPFRGLFGIRNVLFDDAADNGVVTWVEKPFED